jgi:UDP-N-acetylmuramate dehydrogenase
MLNNFRGELRQQEPLAKYTSWQIGGIAKQYYRPVDIDDLSVFLQWLPGTEPVFLLGLGSNVLIRDGGFPGTVIHLHNKINNLSMLEKIKATAVILRIEAGATCAMLARFCQKHGLVGAEFYAGIPGTVGGALAMNAGAFGGETWSHVVRVETINRRGKRFIRMPEEFKVGYRKVVIPNDEWFVVGYLCFQQGDVASGQKKIIELLAQRKKTQPIGELTCGSVFCNPPGIYAAKLIEDSGLKGKTIGKATVSTKHANFIVNQGGATAKDIECLIKIIQQCVLDKYQVKLETEVKFVGEY